MAILMLILGGLNTAVGNTTLGGLLILTGSMIFVFDFVMKLGRQEREAEKKADAERKAAHDARIAKIHADAKAERERCLAEIEARQARERAESLEMTRRLNELRERTDAERREARRAVRRTRRTGRRTAEERARG